MNNRDEFGNTPMSRLIRYLPDATLQVMNQCVTRSHDDKLNKDLEVSIFYTLFFFVLALFIMDLYTSYAALKLGNYLLNI